MDDSRKGIYLERFDFLMGSRNVSLRSTRIKTTTSFLAATKFAYTSGAGITAAAGTRLALHLFNDIAKVLSV